MPVEEERCQEQLEDLMHIKMMPDTTAWYPAQIDGVSHRWVMSYTEGWCQGQIDGVSHRWVMSCTAEWWKTQLNVVIQSRNDIGQEQEWYWAQLDDIRLNSIISGSGKMMSGTGGYYQHSWMVSDTYGWFWAQLDGWYQTLMDDLGHS